MYSTDKVTHTHTHAHTHSPAAAPHCPLPLPHSPHYTHHDPYTAALPPCDHSATGCMDARCWANAGPRSVNTRCQWRMLAMAPAAACCSSASLLCISAISCCTAPHSRSIAAFAATPDTHTYSQPSVHAHSYRQQHGTVVRQLLH